MIATDPTHDEGLHEQLQAQRHHVLGIVDGLSERDLTRPILPSGWTCLGLIRHLALDVERFWFRAVMAGQQVQLETGDGAWRVPEGTDPAVVLTLYREELAAADAVITTTDLQAPPRWWPSDGPSQAPANRAAGSSPG